MSGTDQAAGDDTEATDKVTVVTILVSSTSGSDSLQCCLNRDEWNSVNKPSLFMPVRVITSLCLERSEKSSNYILNSRCFLITERPIFLCKAFFVFL